ncbi:MAG: hypothetical protein Q8O40_06910 [Chloroflexota bacterium]|nr:hypothetical protein [Chloroflexota bacterium]
MESDGVLWLKPKRIRVYIADAQQMWRAVYRIALQRHPDVEVLGSSGDTYCSSLAAATLAHYPDVLLVGVRILRPPDVKRLKQIAQRHPRMGVVALYGKRFAGTNSEDGMVGGRGACVFMHRGEVDTAEQLVQAIRAVAAGHTAASANGSPSNGHGLQTDAETSRRWRCHVAPPARRLA